MVKEAGKEKIAAQNTENGGVKGEEGEEGEEVEEEITVLKEVGSFDKMLIWNHESMVDGDDTFVKGLSEWVGFAEAVSHMFETCEYIHVNDGY